ncbi:hypothetical protein LJC56_09005 [Christensenellaceae bacterium OttesenSCG-928-K19]|nr:hypothetical protein [Christensenellaceae bacterium OttesenSCG-928-K19]
MAKKSFKDNPALQFISTVPPAPQPESASPQSVQQKQSTKVPDAPQQPKRKVTATRRAALPDRGPGFEAKSKRLNLLIRPSLFEAVSSAAQSKGMSNNDLIHQILEQALLSGSIENI